jgi:diaminohydroxyphosphoribosylaminopyrimidine deaminase/5-amino-6-(5-phosphoribosylamino)uracil reductase
MGEALDLARRALGAASPNPAVGCVITSAEGAVVGRGYTQPFGGLHAEPTALTEAGKQAQRGTAYVTLMPCDHHGKTPPCTEALIAAGVKRVVVAVDDPNPESLSGKERLEAAGIHVEVGLRREEACEIMAGFLKHVRTGFPYLRLKYAMTLDGRIATRTGSSQWISGDQSREHVQTLRQESDAVLVGSGTALSDDPRLNVRDASAWQPHRVVIDSQCRLSPAARLFHSHGGPVVVLTSNRAPAENRAALQAAGATLIELAPSEEGRIELDTALKRLGEIGLRTLLCEGGAGLAGALLDHQLIDEVVVYIAPKLIGGAEALSPIGGIGVAKMAAALPLEEMSLQHFGEDLCLRGRLACSTHHE